MNFRGLKFLVNSNIKGAKNYPKNVSIAANPLLKKKKELTIAMFIARIAWIALLENEIQILYQILSFIIIVFRGGWKESWVIFKL